MNYKLVFNVLGKILVLEAALLCVPLILSLAYGEDIYLAYVIPIACLLAAGIPSFIFQPKDASLYAREGFVFVSFSWVIMSLVGAFPFVISKAIPNYIDALFETVSGFTTTGASILSEIESLPKSILFWRSFTHWVGGMGVLVFVLAILPDDNAGSMHVFRAESTGPTVGKLVSKMRVTARILYAIYIVMTMVEVVCLLCGKMSVFDSFVNAFATAGTGGFSVRNSSIAAYDSVYIEMVIAVFMMLFGVSFNVYYLILIGNFAKAFKSEELRVYLGIMLTATVIIAVNILRVYGNFGQAVRYSFFQVSSVMTSTGFITADYEKWPALSQAIIMFLMVIGACAGSTGGGIKVARLVILSKSGVAGVRKLVKPRTIVATKFEGETLSEDVISNVRLFFVFFVGLLITSTLLVSIDGYGTLLANFSASLTCINNIGPGFDQVGPTGNFGGYSAFSKLIFCFDMLAGRLEIFPIITLFSSATWRKH